MAFLDKVDAATNLAKNNELQLLVFKVSNEKDAAYYAINVFKTREVVESKNHILTQIPSAHPLLEGTIILRGMQIPLLNLPKWLGVNLTREEVVNSDILVCDFNGIIIGLRIMYAFRVIKKNWNEIHAPDSYRLNNESVVINDTRLEDGSICLILDYEKLLADVIPQALVNIEQDTIELKKIAVPQKLQTGTVLIAEDSRTAQQHLKQIFQNAKIDMILFSNGKKLIDHIDSLDEHGIDKIAAVVTDIEMPEMSGFTVTKILKSNPLTANIPIIINSSMTGHNNKRESESLGANAFVDKTKTHNIIPMIISLIEEN